MTDGCAGQNGAGHSGADLGNVADNVGRGGTDAALVNDAGDRVTVEVLAV